MNNSPNKFLLTITWLLGELLVLWNFPIYLFCLSVSLFLAQNLGTKTLKKKRGSESAAGSWDGKTVRWWSSSWTPGEEPRRELKEPDSQGRRRGSYLGGLQFRWNGLFIVTEFYSNNRIVATNRTFLPVLAFLRLSSAAPDSPRTWQPIVFLLLGLFESWSVWFIIPSLLFEFSSRTYTSGLRTQKTVLC